MDSIVGFEAALRSWSSAARSEKHSGAATQVSRIVQTGPKPSTTSILEATIQIANANKYPVRQPSREKQNERQ
jgi:hypothetical protein